MSFNQMRAQHAPYLILRQAELMATQRVESLKKFKNCDCVRNALNDMLFRWNTRNITVTKFSKLNFGSSLATKRIDLRTIFSTPRASQFCGYFTVLSQLFSTACTIAQRHVFRQYGLRLFNCTEQ